VRGERRKGEGERKRERGEGEGVRTREGGRERRKEEKGRKGEGEKVGSKAFWRRVELITANTMQCFHKEEARVPVLRAEQRLLSESGSKQ
jgi:hypothetical protein